MSSAAQTTSDRTRQARPEDGAAIWRLVQDDGVLDQNSAYAYVLLCDLFAPTCRVAIDGEDVVGFVVALRPATRPNVIFVWQIGVHADARGKGVAGRLLDDLIESEGGRDATSLEATVTPGNVPSRSLFQSLAKRHGAACRIVPNYYPAPLFPGLDHETEDLFQVGPLGPIRSA